MKQIFQAVFSSVWKRKEVKVYLSFTLFSLVYLVGSFFGNSNFMKIETLDSYKISGIDFIDMMMSSVDGFILPTLAIYFLTISVFKRELDEHTMFLYRDLSRTKTFFAKYVSLILIVVIFHLLFAMISAVVYYTRVVHLPFASSSFLAGTITITLKSVLSLLGFLMKDIFSVTIASVICLYCSTGATMVTAVVLTITMMITPIIGGPVALLFPNGYLELGNDNMPLAILGTIVTTCLYSIIFTKVGAKKFKSLEF
ncbi:hypothetical protein [Streptococcus pluranimalium]|uniref:hypothetical protein n=1 Tax=Streptococcus pluranimalium TaxID=82348 RepID=UPI004047043D